MEDCAVCYEKVSDSTGHCTLSCKHSFHIACLTRWSNENPNCPLCRHPLGAQEAPAKRPTVPALDWMLVMPTVGTGMSHSMQDLMQLWASEPAQPPPPPSARPRIIHIGAGVTVPESDVALVMQHASVTRGQAVRALRHHEGDIVNSILMLTNIDAMPPPQQPPPRDPMVDPSDDQATAWFLQLLFEGEEYPWNSYSDMRWRMNNGLRTHRFWIHREFQIEEEGAKLDAGYESA